MLLGLGANVASLSIRLAKAEPRAIAFERDPETHAMLVQRTTKDPAVEPRQEAIGDQPGTATLFRAKGYADY